MKKNENTQDDGKNNVQKKEISPTLKKMKPLETEIFPIRRMAAVKSTASLLATSQGMKFRTKTRKEDGLFLVTKIA
jgi:hypothetical protein